MCSDYYWPILLGVLCFANQMVIGALTRKKVCRIECDNYWAEFINSLAFGSTSSSTLLRAGTHNAHTDRDRVWRNKHSFISSPVTRHHLVHQASTAIKDTALFLFVIAVQHSLVHLSSVFLASWLLTLQLQSASPSGEAAQRAAAWPNVRPFADEKRAKSGPTLDFMLQLAE